MTVTIGDTTLPGTMANIDSASSVAISVSSPADVALVGEANLTDGEASANEPERITTPIQATRLFGSESPLGKQVYSALANGGSPIYAVAFEPTEVAAEDLSGISSTSGTFSETPVSEDPENVSITVDSTDKTVIKTYQDPSTKTVGTDEAYYNPVTGDFELDQAPSTSGEATYTSLGYTTAHDNLIEDWGETVDMIFPIVENGDVIADAQMTVGEMLDRTEFGMVMGGAAAHIPDTTEYTNPYDTSRTQLIYPARTASGDSTLGAFAGLRAAIGIDTSIIRKRLKGVYNLSETLSRQEKQDLVAENVVPLTNSTRGAQVVDDVTCVLDENLDEANFKDSLSRLITDYVTDTVISNADPYIGELHTKEARDNMAATLRTQLKRLKETNAIVAYEVGVDEADSYTAEVNVHVETVKPLRNVVANITSGELESVAT